MAGQRRGRSGFGQARFRFCALGLCLALPPTGTAFGAVSGGLQSHSKAGRNPRISASLREKDPWQTALAARRSFEAEPAEEHTRDEFTQVMDNFRAIYHDNPASLHAPGAVDQVAALLAEQGRALNDPKSLRAAAGQYQFLARAYPASSLAAPALVQALKLLEAGGAEDRAEAARVRSDLKTHYPHTAVDRLAASGPSSASPINPAGSSTVSRNTANTRALGHPASEVSPPVAAVPQIEPVGDTSLDGRPLAEGAAPAVVTGIRHWSTASYTRVAIDLGGEVQYKAARTEHPDRIFFDLHGAKLAAGLVGKTFAVTDDGFLSTIRAAQAGPNITRVVLDVQPVAEYSAFLLPNPYRLIIDIHGKASTNGGSEATTAHSVARAEARSGADPAAGPTPATRESTSPAPLTADTAANPEQPAAPILRPTPARPAGNSTLPPMPVTDGSAGFGLAPKRSVASSGEAAVARPRVVVPARPTAAKPVPNTTTSATPDSSREVAALGETPGVVTATAQPTSKPVVERTVEHTGEHTAERTGERTGVRAGEPGDPGAVRRNRNTAAATDDAGRFNAAPITPPPPTSDGQSTLMRALGLKIGRIVIDAGHGGHDSGTLGPEGIEEKDVVLEVALRLGKLLHDRLGAEVVYTRADDTFVPLETRTAIANKAQADLFISIHANSSGDPSTRGVEVYYLNFTSDPEAMQVASRENAVSSQRVNQLSDLVKKIALKDKIDESRELAADVDQSLYSGLRKGNAGFRDRGVKKAPFVVLIGANMPSILAEISFVTNPDDAGELQKPGYLERVAESLYNGIARYAGAINGAKPKTRDTERAER